MHRSMVVNGATKFGDMEHFNKYLAPFQKSGGDVTMEYLHEQNLIALQGVACVTGCVRADIRLRALCCIGQVLVPSVCLKRSHPASTCLNSRS